MMTLEQLVTQRRQSQRLGAGLDTAAGVARQVCGLQAQDVEAALLSFRVRSTGLTAAEVGSAWHERGALVRTWCIRGTLHLVTRDDVGWMLPLFGPAFIKKTQRRYQQLGLSRADRLRAVDVIGERLAQHGALTRVELAAYLDDEGVPTEGQAIIHLIRRAALAGVVCYGPYRDGEETFVLLDVEMSDADEESLWDELALRYLAAYGPAQAEDLAKWSGLSVSKARRAFERVSDQLVAFRVEDQSYWLMGEQAPAAGTADTRVLLLPAYDNFLLGYQSRDLIVEAQYAKRVHPGGGYLYPTVLVDNQLAGTWKMGKGKGQIVVQVEPFTSFSPEVVDELESETADLGRFLGLDATLVLEG